MLKEQYLRQVEKYQEAIKKFRPEFGNMNHVDLIEKINALKIYKCKGEGDVLSSKYDKSSYQMSVIINSINL